MLGVLFVGFAMCVPRAALADDAPSPKREVPDYDGRGPPPNGDNAGVWVARIALSPLYLLTEYLVRQPFNALMKPLEANDDLTKLYDFFAFGPNHKMGFAPIGFVEFGFNPSVGFYYFWNDALVTNNAVRAHVEAWPADWFAAMFGDRYVWGDDHAVELDVNGVNRPDQVFYGIGSNSAQSSQSRYREARFDARAMLDTHVWRSSRIKVTGGIRKVDLADGHYGDDPSLSQRAALGSFNIPFGFNRGYLDPYGSIDAAFDTRDPFDPRSGVRLEVEGDLGTDVEHGSAGWVHWGGAASAYWQFDGYRRIVSVTAHASFADPLGSDPIPFTELVMLGGDQWMTGYFPGRLRGRSATTAALRYDWPIASWIDGMVEGVVGNVFDAHLDDFRPGELRFSGVVGITTTTQIIASFAGAGNIQSSKHSAPAAPRIEITAGFGTDTFDHGATIQSFHVAFGVPHGL